MKRFSAIITTELYQLRQDKRIFIALCIYLLILLNSTIYFLVIPTHGMDSFQRKNVLLVIFNVISFSFSSLVSSDITTGEKERKTIEALLATYCPRKLVYWAKCLIVQIFALIPIIFGFLVLLLLKMIWNNTQIAYLDLFILFIVILPFTFLMSSLLVYKGFKAHTMRASKSMDLLIFLCIPFVSLIFMTLTNVWSFVFYLLLTAIFFYFLSKNGIRYLHSEEILL